MPQILAVFGATGNQGGSVIKAVLADEELSSQYKIRALTRDPSSVSSRLLAEKGVDVVRADFDKPETITEAVKGVHTVFANTVSVYGPDGKETEIGQAKAIADACVAAKVEHLFFSSMISPMKATNGDLKRVEHWDSKYEAEKYIRSLPINSTFYWPGSFMTNYLTFQKPRKSQDGESYVIYNILKPETKLPLIDIETDTGKYVAASLRNPDKYYGKVLYGSCGLYTQTQVAEIMSEKLGKKIVYVQVPDEAAKGHYPEGFKEQMHEMLVYLRDYGYFGTEEEMQRKLKESNAAIQGIPTTFEEFMSRNKIDLDAEAGGR